jgi:hypothetical protein
MDSRIEQHRQICQFQQGSHQEALQTFLKNAKKFQLLQANASSPAATSLEPSDGFSRTIQPSEHAEEGLPNTPHAHKAKHNENKLHVPPELLTLAFSGYLGTLNPGLTAGLTNKIDSQFFWNFMMLDFIGMGLPRVSRSLKRGALPYDPEKDPEAQKREGFNKWFYIKKREAENANWPNLYEEFLREAQAAPGSLLVPAMVFSSVPFISRFNALKPLTPPGRRSLLMSTDEAQSHANNIVHFMQKKPISIKNAQDTASLQTLGSGYIKHAFSQIPPADMQQPIDIAFGPKKSNDPYFHVSHRQIETLKKHLHNDEHGFMGIGKALMNHKGKVDNDSPLQLKDVRLNDLTNEWADVQGKLLAFDVTHGMGSAIFGTQAQKQEHAFLTAKQQMLFQLMHQATIQVNSLNNPKSRLNLSMAHLPIHTAEGTKPMEVLPYLRSMDKTRDLLSDGLRNYFKHNNAGSPADALKQTVSSMKGFKGVLSMGSITWMMGWMWYLAHAIQAGREYPANRLVSESMNAPKTVTNELPGFGEVNLSPVEEAAVKAAYVAKQRNTAEGGH